MTYTDQDLDDAVQAGAISLGAATQLREFVAARDASSVADEEHFRLLTGFNDIFVSIAVVLTLFALGWIGRHTGPILVAATSWALAEYFTRRRRMALPSIILLLSFTGSVFATALISLSPPETAHANRIWNGGLWMAISMGLTAVAAYIHWRRFRVPITVTVGCGALVGLIVALVLTLIPKPSSHWVAGIFFVSGISVFLLALRWDASDRARAARRSDVAFWLHLLATPLMVHPLFSMLGLLDGVAAGAWRAVAAIAIYLVLALVALAIDRRALLVSALAYVLYAMSELLRAAGSLEASFAITALAVGTLLLLLSAFWGVTRRLVVQRLPTRIRERLPRT